MNTRANEVALPSGEAAPQTMNSVTPARYAARLFFAFLLLLSGFCGISYEILYGRLLGNIIGDQFAVSASILLTFLLGIGVGAVYAHRLWSWLWLIEAAIGLCGVAFALGIDTLDAWLYANMPLIGAGIGSAILVCIVLLIVPAFLVGCSLPLFAGYLSRLKPGRVFARAYTVYNFGAAVTVLVIEFWLVRSFGLRDAVLTIAALNGFVALCLLFEFGQIRDLRPAAAERIRFPKSHLLALVLVSIGSAVFQLLMIKTAEAFLGPFRETFALVLAVVLLGIALGSAITGGLRLTLTQVLIANLVGLAWLLGGLGIIAELYARLYPAAADSYLMTIALKFGMVVLMMGLPAISFGATIPALLTRQHNVARESGQLLCVSSLANALGFLLMALFLHRHFDYGVLLLVIATLTVVGLAAYAKPFNLRVLAALVLLAAAVGLYRTEWDENLLYLGHTAFHDTEELVEAKQKMDFPEKFKGYQDVFAINWINGRPYFFINGYISISLASPAEKLVGAFSSLFAPRTDRALVLGVGSGATAGTVGLLFDRTDAVEINTVVLDNLFRMAKYNFDIEKRPQVNIIADDAIHHVKVSKETYSLIINTVTTPLYFSSSKLYTHEFLESVRKRLTPDGVYVTWVDSRVGNRGIDIMLNTLRQSFQSCWLGAIKSGYFLLMCSQENLALRHPNLIAEHQELAKYFADQYEILGEWVPYGLLSADAFALIGDRSAPLNTLDRPTLEFEIARLRKRGFGAFKQRLRAHMNLADIAEHYQTAMDWSPIALLLHVEELYGDSSISNRWRTLVEASVADFDERYGEEQLRYHAGFARATQRDGAYHDYGYQLLKRNRCEEAIEQFKLAVAGNPARNNSYFNLGACYERLGQFDLAVENYQKEGQVDPKDEDVPFRLGRVYLKQRRFAEALAAIDTAIGMEDDRAQSYFFKGVALMGLGRRNEAEAAFMYALVLDPDHRDTHIALERIASEAP